MLTKAHVSIKTFFITAEIPNGKKIVLFFFFSFCQSCEIHLYFQGRVFVADTLCAHRALRLLISSLTKDKYGIKYCVYSTFIDCASKHKH